MQKMADANSKKLAQSPSWTPEARERILVAVRAGVGLERAALAGNLTYSQMCAWRRADRTFARAVDAARAVSREVQMDTLRRVMASDGATRPL